MRNLMSSLLLAALSMATLSVNAKQEYEGLMGAEIDALVTRVMEKFQVPGIAVGIIKDGKVTHAKGYGMREVGRKGKVDTETLFSIASTGKSFTAVSLALLVDEGKIQWDDKVIDHIPNFRLYDPWVTREFTIKDLLIHNSGLGLGAGDLMFFPSEGFSRQEIIANLRHLKPVSSFRTEYAYDNLLYIVAGEVIATVSGLSYENFVDQRILKPLGMEHCTANPVRLEGDGNIASHHIVQDGWVKAMPRAVPLGKQTVFAAAGGMLCSIDSIMKWHQMHLNKGKLPNGNVFLSEAQQSLLMTPQTIIPVMKTEREWFGTNFTAYGLGWRLKDYNGFKVEQHGGGLLGMLTFNIMLPELNLGLAVYTNQQAGVARPAIVNSILEAYTSGKRTDWVSRYDEQRKKRRAAAMAVVPDVDAVSYQPTVPLVNYGGTYKDPWFCEVAITVTNEELHFRSIRSERLKGRMVPYKPNLFIVRWDDRTLDADAYVKFTTNYDGEPTGITMKAISFLTDFSFDFHDLNFTRVVE